MSTTGDLAALMGAVVQALKGGSSSPLTQKQEETLMMGKAMQILSGDFSPFDEIKEFLADFVKGEVAANNNDRALYASKLTSKAHRALGENVSINTELASACTEESEPLTVTNTVLAKHLPILVALLLDHDNSMGKFSDALKAVCVEMVGEWLEGLCGCMTNGKPGLQAFLQRMSMVGGMQIAQNYPTHAQSAMFGFPMLLNLMTQFHDQYRTAHNIQ